MKKPAKDVWLSEHITMQDAEGIRAKCSIFIRPCIPLDLIAYAYELGYENGYTTRSEGK